MTNITYYYPSNSGAGEHNNCIASVYVLPDQWLAMMMCCVFAVTSVDLKCSDGDGDTLTFTLSDATNFAVTAGKFVINPVSQLSCSEEIVKLISCPHPPPPSSFRKHLFL